MTLDMHPAEPYPVELSLLQVQTAEAIRINLAETTDQAANV